MNTSVFCDDAIDNRNGRELVGVHVRRRGERGARQAQQPGQESQAKKGCSGHWRSIVLL